MRSQSAADRMSQRSLPSSIGRQTEALCAPPPAAKTPRRTTTSPAIDRSRMSSLLGGHLPASRTPGHATTERTRTLLPLPNERTYRPATLGPLRPGATNSPPPTIPTPHGRRAGGARPAGGPGVEPVPQGVPEEVDADHHREDR